MTSDARDNDEGQDRTSGPPPPAPGSAEATAGPDAEPEVRTCKVCGKALLPKQGSCCSRACARAAFKAAAQAPAPEPAPDDGEPKPPDNSDPGTRSPEPAEAVQASAHVGVKAVPPRCPHCGSHKRKVVRSARLPDAGAWFQGAFIRGIVRQTCECLGCRDSAGKPRRYGVTDVIRT